MTSKFEQTPVFQSRVKSAFGSYCLRHKLKLDNEVSYWCDVSCMNICRCKFLSKGTCISKSTSVCEIEACFSKEAMSKVVLKEYIGTSVLQHVLNSAFYIQRRKLNT